MPGLPDFDQSYQRQQREDADEAIRQLINAVQVDDTEAISDRELLERMSRVLLFIAAKVGV